MNTTPSTLHIYKASAGSGKTFALAINYLKLVLQQPFAFQGILAVTFTNKATAEMKERILQVIKGLATADDSDKIAAYRNVLLNELPQLNSDQLQQRAAQAYTAILHNYSRFFVTTIDKFVQRIIRSFAWELGIDSGFRLQLKTDPVKEDLADRLFKRLDGDEQLRTWIVNMAAEKLQQGKRWDFRDDMIALAGELFKDEFVLFEKSIAGYSEEELHAKFTQLQQQVYPALRKVEAQYKTYGEEGLQIIASAGLIPDDFAYGKASFAQAFQKMSQGEVLTLGSRAVAAITDVNSMYSKKTSPEIIADIQSISDALQQVLNKIHSNEAEMMQTYYTAKAVANNLYLMRLMVVMAKELAAYRSENNALLISDTHQLLRELTSNTHTPFIYEKTGTHFHHFLIDEFQDTSVTQWNNFYPLLQESLAAGRYNLVVGDVKQAIYRWRNGDWQLLHRQVQEKLAGFKPFIQSLQDNYRSAKPVIEFNNLLFKTAPVVMQQMLQGMLLNTTEETLQALRQAGFENVFAEAYADAQQEIPAAASVHGEVRINFIPKKECAEMALAQLTERISELRQQGYNAGDMAILTRTNNEARLVVQHLLAEQNENDPFSVMSAEALLLSSNLAVSLLLATVQWLAEPDNVIALAQVRQLYYVLHSAGEMPGPGTYASNAPMHSALKTMEDNRLRLLQLSVSELINELCIQLGLNTMKQHQAFLHAFFDVVKSWSENATGGLSAFVTYWQNEGDAFALPPPADTNAIEVVTIHRSKGLAYSIVLMPFMSWSMLPKSSSILWVDSHLSTYNSFATLPINYSKSLAQSEFALPYFRETIMSFMDNLNMLYVACTRARKAIYGWAALPSKSDDEESGGNSINNILYACYKQFAGKSEEANCWQHGELHTEVTSLPVNAAKASIKPVYSRWQQHSLLRYNNQNVSKETDATILPRSQGIVYHSILALLQRPQQLTSVIEYAVAAGLLPNTDKAATAELLENVIALPALKPWWSNLYNVLQEQPVITEDKTLRRPDLVLYNQHECIVYDFKFSHSEKTVTNYNQQMQGYLQLLNTMGFAASEGHIIYAYQLRSETVKHLPAK